MPPPRISGVVAQEAGKPPILRDDLRLRRPAADEVRIRISASGICHSDVGVATGAMTHQPLPVVLGHEGAGVVVEVGAAARGVTEGDRVVVTLPPPPCGRCEICAAGNLSHCRNRGTDNGPAFSLGGEPVYSMFRIGSLAQETILPASRVVPVGDLPMEQACLLGCGITTAFGAVVNTARVSPGSTVVVVGCGGVGMGIIESARAAGARVIAAVDTNTAKLDAAKAFGATHMSLPAGLPGLRQAATGGAGFDFGFEVTGNPEAFTSMLNSLARGGLGVLVGIPPVGERFALSNEFLFSGRRLAASFVGDGDPVTDIPRYLAQQASGAVAFDGLVSEVRGLDGAVDALTTLAAGGAAAVRTVITMPA
jgi:S-(hydroxymethyl)glutathione dehydrogenase / alcohol dehydrogenase